MKITVYLMIMIFLQSFSCNRAPMTDISPNVQQISLWLTYWDNDGIVEDINAISGLTSLNYFGAYFNWKNNLVIPELTASQHMILKSLVKNNFLTVVNDIKYDSGSSSLKDIDLLETLFSSNEAMDSHIKELITVAARNNFTGIEIDYEQVHKRPELPEKFALFIGRLLLKTQEAGLSLRVVLETGFPIKSVKLPEGPEYCVMMYNLHYSSTSPGPKADCAFIRDIISKFNVLGSDLIVAFATGGYDFNGNSAVQVTEKEADRIFRAYGASPKRDSASGALYFHYTKNGEKHTVYYADATTMKLWMSEAMNAGVHNFAIWRAGGNLSLGSWKK